MKPCKKCKTPLENKAEACPTCGQRQGPVVAVQDGPGRTPPSRPLDKAEIWQDVRTSLSLIARSVFITTLLAGIGGGIGYYFGDVTGLIVGAIVGFILKFLLFGAF